MHNRPASLEYGIAVASVLLVAAFKYALIDIMPLEEGVFLFFTLAVIVSSVYGGLRPGMLSAGLSLAIGGWWCWTGSPQYGLDVQDWVRIVYFGIEAPLIAWGSERIQTLSAERKQELIDKEADKRMRLLLDSAPDAMVVIDRSLRIVLLNTQAERLFGYNRTELIGEPIETLIPQRLRVAHRTHTERFFTHPTVRAMGAHHASQLLGLKRDGLEFPVEVSLSPIAVGGDTLVASAIRDVTSRLQHETRKEERAEGRWKFLAESVPAVVWTADRNGIATFMAGQWEQITGSPFLLRDPSFSWKAQLHPDDSDRVLSEWKQCVLTREVFDMEYRLRSREGGYRWFKVRGVPLKDEDGEVLEWLGSMADIDTTKQAEQRAEESRRHVAAILDTAPVAVITIDENAIVYSWNGMAEAMYGWTAEEIIGKPFPLIPTDEYEAWREAVVDLHAKGKVRRGEEVLRKCKGGEMIPITLWTASVEEAGGQRLYIHIGVDARERKTYEDKLRQAAKMEAVGRLAGGIAHDFNNMLQVISGYSRIILDESASLSKEHGEFIYEIASAADRATKLTSKLLAFSRRQVVKKKVVDVNAQLEGQRNFFSRLVTEDIPLILDLHPEAGRVYIDPTQFDQIFLNLLVNARQAMPRGGKVIIDTTSVLATEEYAVQHPGLSPGVYSRITVTDTGEGMPPEVRARIFEPFFTTKGEGATGLTGQGGTGLGLSTVYGTVKQNNGEIYVYSEVGHGTTFKVFLPQIPANFEEEEGGQDIDQSTGPRPAGSEHILIVEDDDAVRKIIRTMFANHGYRIKDTGDAEEAIYYASQNAGQIDLLLTDVIMPQMNGKELFNELLKTQPQMNVVFMSGFPGTVIVQQGTLDANVEFLQKPFVPESLHQKIRSVLDARKPL